ncbi:hypothetical protein C6370_08820 [Bacillus atrophaeus]|uniref:Integral inner membrane protein n=1 Tax=Bacillus atrophaeus (strain 1942) TaxID=720555 RepID=A0ABM5M1X2_BACA1|nr:hypothetical protein [Bacillus atrophaeus]AMR61144.1 hypothetical protein A1D11_01455 [Bacillus subtilis subsp. globigii]ADP34178.1 putative integral inner membrane protein [Bacillus atrophaeus 1942]AIK49107.1 hypothetical protein DJ95_3150 [Bacillus atrophaeus subsp. globigii]AKL86673.1 YwmF [Bacillus atrophaeus UCMB-5137]ATO27306.1 hypothetical protein RA13_04125 [Bacillus atrophaeus]
MFGFNDMWKFFWSFLIVLPLVSVTHVAGHSFMAFIFGGKASLDIGMGKKLFKIGPIRVRRIYFVDSFCQFGNLKIDNRFSNALVYGGGCLFNFISIFTVNLLILNSVLEPNMFFYQFVYFSTYYIFFALLPVRYSEKKLSDGLAIYKVLRYGERYEIHN